MNKILTLAASLLVVSSTTALAGGLNFSYSNCGAAGAASTSFNCALNTGALPVAYGSVIPNAAATQIVAVGVVIDLQAGTPTLPSWWAVQSGGCRQGAASLSSDVVAATDCASLFDLLLPSDVLPVGQVQVGVGGPNRVRLYQGAAWQGSLAQTIDNTTEYVVVKMAVNRTKSTGAGSCAGCNVGAQITLNEVQLVQPNGAPGGDQIITNPANSSTVTYISTAAGAVAPPAIGATSSQNRTWGAVKALYR